MPDASDAYLRDAVMTATPEQLHLMLYDGAIRFTRAAAEAMTRNAWEAAYDNFTRAQRIIVEMTQALNYNVDADLCKRMASLYNFLFRKLVDANVNRDSQLAQEVIDLLEYQRETWVMVMGKLQEERAAQAAPAPPARAMSLSNRSSAVKRTPPPPSPAAETNYGSLCVEG